jgi:hypothetical protein
MIYFDKNRITVKAKKNAIVGNKYNLNGDTYYVVNEQLLKKMIMNDEDVSKVVTTRITSMNSLFKYKYFFNQNISSWDVSNVENMSRMFNCAKSFNQDIGAWNVMNVNKMDSMFEGAASFDQNIGVWNVKNVTVMNSMFERASSFNQDIAFWNVSKVLNMSRMFFEAIAFNKNLCTWDVSTVYKRSIIFKGALAFKSENFPFHKTIKNKRVILRKSPFQNNLLPADNKILSKIKKFLVQKDFSSIDIGIELLRALNKLELFEVLLENCRIEEDGSFQRNVFFTGFRTAQPFLDYALIYLIAYAPDETKLHQSLIRKNITILYLDETQFSINECNFKELPLDRFENLQHFIFSPTSTSRDKSDCLISSNSITEITIKNSFLKNIDGLFCCPNLKKLRISSSTIKNLDGLINCTRLRQLVVDDAYDLENIDGLKNCIFLEYLKLKSEDKLKNIDSLLYCTSLKEMYLDCEIENINGLVNCLNIDSLSIKSKRLENVNSLSSCLNLQKLKLKNCDNLKNLNGLKNCKNIKDLEIEIPAFIENFDFIFKQNKLEKLKIKGDKLFNQVTKYNLENI